MIPSENSREPLYVQIKQDIMLKIQEGVFAYGDQIPPEMQLAEDYKVSRPTVRQAIKELVQEGVLKRNRGIGTFITKPMITEEVDGFKTLEQLKGLNWSELYSINKCHSTAELAQLLNLEEDEEVVEVTFIKGNDDEKLVLRKYQIPSRLVPNLINQYTENKGFDLFLQDKYGLTITRSALSFKSQVATKEIVKCLGINKGAPLTLFETLLYQGEVPFARIQTWFCGERFKFVVEHGKQVGLPLFKLKRINEG